MSETPQAIVSQAYDHISDWYLEWVSTQKSPRERYTNLLLSQLPAAPRLLELGCGPGVPTLQHLLARGAHVVANDISAKQIELARARCPAAELIAGDMAALSFAPASFDGVLSFYTLFHLPRAQLRAMLDRIFVWLRPGAGFVANLAVFDEEEIHGEMMGHGMFWSSFGEAENRGLLAEVGFERVEVERVVAGNGTLEEGEPDYEAEFMWVSAWKPRVEG